MIWNLEEAMAYYKKQGAPSDQNALVRLLSEIQEEMGLSADTLERIAREYGVKPSFLMAVVKRYPRLRLADTHCLELCAGAGCARRKALAEFVEKTYGPRPQGFTVKQVPCMRQCGKGPNIKWDGRLYSGADEALLRRLIGR